MKITEIHLKSILNALCSDPHAVLGMHPYAGKPSGIIVRSFLRDCKSCGVVAIKMNAVYSMEKIAEEGFFEVFIPGEAKIFPYQLRMEKYNGEVLQFYDPYSFLPTLMNNELYLFNEGNWNHAYDRLGSHFREVNGIKGVSFAVWAPNAKRVSVVGDFNHWDGRYHMMRSMGASGIWELFIPGLEEGLKYKYELMGDKNNLLIKTDPYATYFESPPNNASIIWNTNDYVWGDDEWMEKRKRASFLEKPVSIYEIHFGSWRRVVEDGNRPLTYREMAHQLPEYVKKMGFTHVEFLPLAEHPFTGSWGYQVTGFFAPTHRFGTPQDFKYLIDQLHQAGIGVILDWVPGHFPKDAFALANFDGSYLYEHEDPRQGEHKEWGTLVFNYGRHEVALFLRNSALAWLDRYHIDGLRVDAVASMLYLDYARSEGEWVPNEWGGRENVPAIEFLRKTNSIIHQYFPGVLMIAEESTAFGGITQPCDKGGLAFDYKWNMGWMHDVLRYFSKDAIYRKYHHSDLTFGMLYQYSENFMCVFSHDEVVHGKGSLIMRMPPWSMSEKAQSLRALYGFMWGWPGKKTLFMGQEFGQSSEWRYDASLDWHLLQYGDHSGIQKLVTDLNHWYRAHNSIAQYDYRHDGFRWVNPNDADNGVISFLRLGATPTDTFFVVGNFTPVTRENFRLGVPYAGFWKEVVNTNSELYGGNGLGNLGGKKSERIDSDWFTESLQLTLPGLTTLIFKYEG